MDHDRLFKQLLTTFFVEFVDAFLPDVAKYLDATSIEFLDKEVFRDIAGGGKRIVDLIVKARFKGKDTCFLIHVENQSERLGDFPARMFLYFTRLFEKYRLPIYPVVIFSYAAPKTPEPHSFEIAFPNKNVLKFDYDVIQLNRLPWRQYVNNPNPAAAALMSRMDITVKDRPYVKLECLRLLATLKLDVAKSDLIAGFVESYLKLTAAENRVFEDAVSKLSPEIREESMEIISSYRRKGRQEGKEEMVSIILEQRFSTLPESITSKLDKLTSTQFNQLGKVLLDLDSLEKLDAWLSEHVR